MCACACVYIRVYVCFSLNLEGSLSQAGYGCEVLRHTDLTYVTMQVKMLDLNKITYLCSVIYKT